MQLGSGVGAGVGGGGGGGVGAGVGSAVGRGVGAAVGRGVGVAVGRGVGVAVGRGVGAAGTGVGWGVAPGAPGVGATGAPGTPGPPPSPPETPPPPGPPVAPGAPDAPGANGALPSGAIEALAPDGAALAPATPPVGGAPEAPAAITDVPGDTPTRRSRPGPEAAGTMAAKDIATIAVMSRPRPIPIAVWRWSGSIRTIGLLLTRPLGRHRDRTPRIPLDGVTDGCGVVRWGYEDVSGTGIAVETVVRRRAR
jgi:hypothetical protein